MLTLAHVFTLKLDVVMLKYSFITRAPKTKSKRFPSKLHFKLKTFPLYTGEGLLPWASSNFWAYTSGPSLLKVVTPQFMVGPGHRPLTRIPFVLYHHLGHLRSLAHPTLSKGYKFTWVYNTLTLKVAWTL